MAILLIHGGAGTISEHNRPAYEAGLEQALRAGFDALTGPLQSESLALAAVLAAVSNMESNPEAFNAGVGGALTRDGRAELEACVMVSHTTGGRRAGAVAGITNSPNPVLLADRVRRDSPHVLLIGPAAESLVEQPVASDALITRGSRESLERWRTGNAQDLEQAVETQPPQGSNTVGAVALDDAGNLAAATSTGGRTGQWSGRVGDAPLPGLGTWADELVAVSCTGVGEAFMEAGAATRLAMALEAGVPLEEAVKRTLTAVERMGGHGGLIAVTASGRLSVGFNSSHMAYGIATSGTGGDTLFSEVALTPLVRVTDGD